LLSSYNHDDDNLSLPPTTTDCRDQPRQNDVMLTPRQDGVISTIDKESNTKTSKTFAPSARGSVQDSDYGDELSDGSGKAITEELSYEDIDDDGNDVSQKGISSLRNPKWKQPTKNPLCRKALAATNRKYFSTKKEGTSWLEIEKSILPQDYMARSDIQLSGLKP